MSGRGSWKPSALEGLVVSGIGLWAMSGRVWRKPDVAEYRGDQAVLIKKIIDENKISVGEIDALAEIDYPLFSCLHKHSFILHPLTA